MSFTGCNMDTAFTTICKPAVMSNQDQCCAELCVKLEDQVNNMLTSRRIQVSCGFVCKQNLDRGSKCACNCNPAAVHHPRVGAGNDSSCDSGQLYQVVHVPWPGHQYLPLALKAASRFLSRSGSPTTEKTGTRNPPARNEPLPFVPH